MTPAEVLQRFTKIAVIGMSPNPDRPSHYVSAHMIGAGYEIIGVNPGQTRILDRPVVPRIQDVMGDLEIVAVFRSSEFLSSIVDDLLPRKPQVLWIQLGISDPDAEARAEHSGIVVIRQRCLMVEEQRLAGSKS